jgi:hypothetical protein
MRDISDGDAFLSAMLIIYPFIAGSLEADSFEVRDAVYERIIKPPVYDIGVKSNYSLSLSLSLSLAWRLVP